MSNLSRCAPNKAVYFSLAPRSSLLLPPPAAELPSSPGGQFTFRPLPPPPPPPHACTCARPAPYTQVSLQRKTMPTRCQANQGSQGPDAGSGTDQAQLHNSWVLNSNIPLETR